MWTITGKDSYPSVGSRTLCRAVLVGFLLLSLVAVQSWAAPSKQTGKENVQTAVSSEAVASPTAQTSQPNASTGSSKESLDRLNERLQALQESLASSKKVTQEMRDELADLAVAFQTYVSMEGVRGTIAADSSGKIDRELSDLMRKNAEQAGQLATAAGELKAERGTKLLAKGGAVIGFRDHMPAWGLTASFGARFGKGFLVEAGIQYLIGSFSSTKLRQGLDNLQFTTSLGWEW